MTQFGTCLLPCWNHTLFQFMAIFPFWYYFVLTIRLVFHRTRRLNRLQSTTEYGRTCSSFLTLPPKHRVAAKTTFSFIKNESFSILKCPSLRALRNEMNMNRFYYYTCIRCSVFGMCDWRNIHIYDVIMHNALFGLNLDEYRAPRVL